MAILQAACAQGPSGSRAGTRSEELESHNAGRRDVQDRTGSGRASAGNAGRGVSAYLAPEAPREGSSALPISIRIGPELSRRQPVACPYALRGRPAPDNWWGTISRRHPPRPKRIHGNAGQPALSTHGAGRLLLNQEALTSERVHQPQMAVHPGELGQDLFVPRTRHANGPPADLGRPRPVVPAHGPRRRAPRSCSSAVVLSCGRSTRPR